jgi:hypothetical protein
MRWIQLPRIWRTLQVAAALLAGACGGDAGSGPGGGGRDATYDLVGVNGGGLPEVVQVENCRVNRFTSGLLELNEDGTFELDVVYDNDEGQDGFQDHGQFHDRGDGDLSFLSEAWGDRFEGEIDGDLVVLYYDFCTNGVADTEFAFEG